MSMLACRAVPVGAGPRKAFPLRKQHLFTMQYENLQPSRTVTGLIDDVRNNLLDPPRSIPCKYLYDTHGYWLFERICETEEYYPTRAEMQLLSDFCEHIVEASMPDQLLELGSGNSSKIHVLLESCKRRNIDCSYMPLDICEHAMQDACQALREKYSWLEIRPVLGDYHAGLSNLPQAPGRRLYLFLGGTVGNLGVDEFNWFFSELATAMNPGDWLLLGADRVKEPAVLNAAYNDSGDYTARFNLNVLRVLNRELQADFRLDRFRHEASYNVDLERIEMYLVSERHQRVRLQKLSQDVRLNEGEKILTEISRKFSYNGLRSLLAAHDLDVQHHFEPENHYFSLVLARYRP